MQFFQFILLEKMKILMKMKLINERNGNEMENAIFEIRETREFRYFFTFIFLIFNFIIFLIFQL